MTGVIDAVAFFVFKVYFFSRNIYRKSTLRYLKISTTKLIEDRTEIEMAMTKGVLEYNKRLVEIIGINKARINSQRALLMMLFMTPLADSQRLEKVFISTSSVFYPSRMKNNSFLLMYYNSTYNRFQ
jgi:hypothetical protein